MKKILCLFTVAMLLLTGLLAPQSKSVHAATTTVELLSINDFHGRLEQAGKDPGLAKVTGAIKQYQAANPNTAVVAAGDLFQGSPISNLTKGEATAKALKELNIQYSALGNHEFDWDPGEVGIPKWEATAGFKFLAANIYDTKTGQRSQFAKPTAMITVGGKKIGLIGIATPETAYKTNLANIQGLDFRDPVNDINTLAVDLKAQGADAVVVLSHLGAMQDKAGTITGEAAEAAKKIKGVSAIITGHTHQTIQGMVNDVSIVQAASYGRALAHTILTFDDATGKVTATPKVDQLTPQIASLPEDQKTKEIIAAERNKLSALLDVAVADNPNELKHGRFEELSALGQYFSYLAGQQLVDKGYVEKQPIVLMNGGGFRDSIAAGKITQGTMYNIMPFDNYLVTMDLTREQLKKNVENGILNTNVGWVQFSGLTVYYDPTKPAGDRITEMYYTPMDETGKQTNVAEEIVDGKLYKVVTNDFMFTGGDLYDFKGAQNVKTYDGDLLRDAVQAQLKKLGTVTYNHVPRLLAVPDSANKLPEFSKNLAGFEYDLATAKMYKVDMQGKKVEVKGSEMAEIVTNMLIEAKGDNSTDVSQDYIIIKSIGGTFIKTLEVGNKISAEKLKSGENYDLTITVTDGKISPRKTKALGPVEVSKTYQVKVVGQAPTTEMKKAATKPAQTETLPDTSGKEGTMNIAMSVMIGLLSALTFIVKKYQ